MTVQAQESLEYRDEKYSLIGAPFYPFLEKHKEIKFENYTTAHWCGYQGYWLLEDNKLFLTNLKSANYTIKDIFKTDGPILAEWFTGKLEFGIGNYHPDHWWGYYDSYVWLNIENGKVIEKKIIKRFYQELEFNFGKYKGKKFEEVINGKIQRNTYTTIKNFINSLLEFMQNNEYRFKVQCPHFNVTEKDVKLVREIRNYNIDYFLTQNYIAISSKAFWENSIKDEKASNLSNLLEKILVSDFNTPFTLTKQNLDNAEIAEQTLLINPDLQYLNWVLKTVEFFAIPPSYLEKEFTIKRLKKIRINRLNDTIFEYEPEVEILKYTFSDYILKINQEKFEKINNVKYIPEYGFFIPNISENELMNNFGHYLDENFIKQIEINVEDHNFDPYDDYYERESFGQYEGSYAQDIEGLSDDFINDVLDGDPDAYWNID